MNFLKNLLDIIFIILISAFLFSLPTMWLWNWLMPTILGLGKITWIQAVGINFLSGILFKSSK